MLTEFSEPMRKHTPMNLSDNIKRKFRTNADDYIAELIRVYTLMQHTGSKETREIIKLITIVKYVLSNLRLSNKAYLTSRLLPALVVALHQDDPHKKITPHVIDAWIGQAIRIGFTRLFIFERLPKAIAQTTTRPDWSEIVQFLKKTKPRKEVTLPITEETKELLEVLEEVIEHMFPDGPPDTFRGHHEAINRTIRKKGQKLSFDNLKYLLTLYKKSRR